MTLVPARYNSPLPTQFWLWGLDARTGDLLQRGFVKSRPSGLSGSSVYTLGGLQLHSSGLWLATPRGTLHIERNTGLATLGGAHIAGGEALARVRPHVLEHEAWVAAQRGPAWRLEQLEAHQLPAPIRRSVRHWKAWGVLSDAAQLPSVLHLPSRRQGALQILWQQLDACPSTDTVHSAVTSSTIPAKAQRADDAQCANSSRCANNSKCESAAD